MGVKRPAKPNLNPGPGSYNVDAAELARRPATAKAAAFSQTKRAELWKEEKNKANLGPAYEKVRSTFDQS